jgi:2-polyprenyl-6-methoxyphenol hydroxylase-like FAD-dependent oxidoreductase
MLAREGHRVVALDRMDAPQPIGSGLILQPVGLAVLDEIGAGPAIRALGAPIRRLYGRVVPAQRVVLDVRYRSLGKKAGQGLAVHRGALFGVLLDAARKAGVEFVQGREIIAREGQKLAFRDGARSASFDLIIDALGVRSPLARKQPPPPLPFGALWANLPWAGPFEPDVLEQRYRRADTMAGVLPIGRIRSDSENLACFFWSLRQRDLAAWRAGGLDQWKPQVLALWPDTRFLLDQVHRQDQLIFASYSHATLRPAVAEGLAHIGDAWHSASPQLGQGANMALLDAMALARSVNAGGAISDMLHRYARARARHIAIYQLASWMFTPAYQSDSRLLAFIRDWIASPISRIWPAPTILAALVAGAIGAPLRAIESIGVDD